MGKASIPNDVNDRVAPQRSLAQKIMCVRMVDNFFFFLGKKKKKNLALVVRYSSFPETRSAIRKHCLKGVYLIVSYIS